MIIASRLVSEEPYIIRFPADCSGLWVITIIVPTSLRTFQHTAIFKYLPPPSFPQIH